MSVNKEKFVIQWHITHKCNLRCKHCYQDDYCSDLDLDNLILIFNQIKDFFVHNNYKGHINFTGGEPFINNNIWELMRLCEDNEITFGILTNGTLIKDSDIIRLKGFRCLRFIQISIDGDKKVHDSIRGEGNFNKSLDTLKRIGQAGIQTMVSFTVNKSNKECLHKVIKACNKSKVDRFWTDRLIPMGSNNLDCVSTDEYKKYLKKLRLEIKKSEFKRKLNIKSTYIHNNRALQFMCNMDRYRNIDVYKCSAGKNLLVILANGELLPCRRLPLTLGNLVTDNIKSIYKTSDILKELREEKVADDCKNCIHSKTCNGGAKCLTYALMGRLDEKDVNCWM